MEAGRDPVDGQPGGPYRPPTEVDRARSRRSPLGVLTLASALWMLLAVKVVVAGFVLRPMFEDFDFELPWLSRSLLHPMASVFFLATVATLVVGGFALDSRAKRDRLGRIAMLLGLIAFAVASFGLISPLLSLIRSLS